MQPTRLLVCTYNLYTMDNTHFTMQEQTILQAIPAFPNDRNNHPNIIHIHINEVGLLSFGDLFGDMNIGTVEQMSVQSPQPKPQPQTTFDRNRRAVLAVHQHCSCNAADWAVVVKLLEEQGAFPKSAYLNAAAYINEICGQEVTAPESIARSAIYTKIIGKYPNWRIKDGEESRKAPNKLRKYLQIAQVFIEAQNA